MRVGALAGMGATPYGATPYSMNGRPQPHLGSDSSPDVDLFSGLPGLPEQSSSLQGLVDHSITLTQASPLFTRRAPIMPGLPSPLEIEDKAEKLERLERDLERSVYDEAVTNIKVSWLA